MGKLWLRIAQAGALLRFSRAHTFVVVMLLSKFLKSRASCCYKVLRYWEKLEVGGG